MKLLSFSFLLLALGSTSAVKRTPLKYIPLDSKKEDVEQSLGKPNDVVPISDSLEDIGWVYFDNKKEDRATLVFNKMSGKLGAKTWRVKDGDSEREIETVLRRYPNAHFKKRKADWINPHIAPDEVYYEDKSLNLSVEVRSTRNEVSRISWFLPSYAPTTKKCVKFQTENGLISCMPEKK